MKRARDNQPRFRDKGTILIINGERMRPAPEWRCDQAVRNTQPFDGPGAWSALTPDGISALEEHYANRIQAATRRRDLLSVRAAVKADAHLHWRIKQNLLLNIRNYLRGSP